MSFQQRFFKPNLILILIFANIVAYGCRSSHKDEQKASTPSRFTAQQLDSMKSEFVNLKRGYLVEFKNIIHVVIEPTFYPGHAGTYIIALPKGYGWMSMRPIKIEQVEEMGHIFRLTEADTATAYGKAVQWYMLGDS
ncbi:MAG: hypothetical protein ABSF47_02860 [Minisyncoccia bacterium]|jgi:hypothetical protein